MEDLQMMPSGMLLENFRSLCRGTGAAKEGSEDKTRLTSQADLYEQEILRRMAW